MTFVECLGVSQEDTMEGPLWRETLGRSLGSHNAAELVGGMCHGNGCRQETTRLHAIFCTRTAWSSLTHNWVLHQALARSLRESKVQCVVEGTWPFREIASGQNGRLNPLRMDITAEAEALFDDHPRLKNKALLLDIPSSNLARRLQFGECSTLCRKTPRRRSRAEEKEVSGLVLRYLLPPSTRYVDLWGGWLRHACPNLAEGTEVARLRQRFFFVLQQALSFHTHHHLCRQEVALASIRPIRLQGPVYVHTHRTEGVTGSEG